ncbi:dienelactone hydrolase family protein [Paenibacillus hexagrammi]|uniref:Alpha/beta hydrolase family protein n=1 Tax=Paenibacillus hexagrammi TaxID=2908839 RepID=A0ABY3SR30_9BACL|nr:alpha/beta hydrolase family protein [Paenibacillus sp. YPD9-1]UJF35616.1 alpha/beta hydrolase family protein [Paenibacillus sp. YPD9-1]
MWCPDLYMDHLYMNASDKMRRIEPTWNERKEKVRAKLIEVLGSFDPPPDELNAVVLEKQDMGDYSMERVVYQSDAYLQIPAYVLIPHRLEEAAPAVLAWHGHGYGSREIVGLRPDGSVDEEKQGMPQHYAVQLVKKGMVVIAPEIIGFGDRRLSSDMKKDPKKSSSCAPLASRLLMYGKTLTGLRIYEAMRSLDYLRTREEADAERIGTIGFSGGGLIASLSAALDDRIKAAVVCAFTSTFRGSLLSVNHCIDNYLPAILPYADLPELIGLIAPRALFVESGLDDPLFPAESVREAAVVLREIYESTGHKERLEVDLFPGKHEVSGRQSFDWLEKQLKGLKAGFPL